MQYAYASQGLREVAEIVADAVELRIVLKGGDIGLHGPLHVLALQPPTVPRPDRAGRLWPTEDTVGLFFRRNGHFSRLAKSERSHQVQMYHLLKTCPGLAFLQGGGGGVVAAREERRLRGARVLIQYSTG